MRAEDNKTNVADVEEVQLNHTSGKSAELACSKCFSYLLSVCAHVRLANSLTEVGLQTALFTQLTHTQCMAQCGQAEGGLLNNWHLFADSRLGPACCAAWLALLITLIMAPTRYLELSELRRSAEYDD